MGERSIWIEIEVNGRVYKELVGVHETLLDVIREKLGLKGAKEGCGCGQCGACTLLLEGQPVNACLMLAVQADQKRVTTIEGLAPADGLHPIQKAFIEEHAVQCGYCTSGMILSSKAFLDKKLNARMKRFKRPSPVMPAVAPGIPRLFRR